MNGVACPVDELWPHLGGNDSCQSQVPRVQMECLYCEIEGNSLSPVSGVQIPAWVW